MSLESLGSVLEGRSPSDALSLLDLDQRQLPKELEIKIVYPSEFVELLAAWVAKKPKPMATRRAQERLKDVLEMFRVTQDITQSETEPESATMAGALKRAARLTRFKPASRMLFLDTGRPEKLVPALCSCLTRSTSNHANQAMAARVLRQLSRCESDNVKVSIASQGALVSIRQCLQFALTELRQHRQSADGGEVYLRSTISECSCALWNLSGAQANERVLLAVGDGSPDASILPLLFDLLNVCVDTSDSSQSPITKPAAVDSTCAEPILGTIWSVTMSYADRTRSRNQQPEVKTEAQSTNNEGHDDKWVLDGSHAATLCSLVHACADASTPLALPDSMVLSIVGAVGNLAHHSPSRAALLRASEPEFEDGEGEGERPEPKLRHALVTIAGGEEGVQQAVAGTYASELRRLALRAAAGISSIAPTSN